MPLPKDMSACMSKTKKEFPGGRSKKKKGKKAAHAQRVAMCLNAQKEGSTMTFKDFLAENTIRSQEGSINQATLDSMIASVLRRFDIDTSIQDIRNLVIMDYEDSDISQVTPRDIIEILDASGI